MINYIQQTGAHGARGRFVKQLTSMEQFGFELVGDDDGK